MNQIEQPREPDMFPKFSSLMSPSELLMESIELQGHKPIGRSSARAEAAEVLHNTVANWGNVPETILQTTQPPPVRRHRHGVARHDRPQTPDDRQHFQRRGGQVPPAGDDRQTLFAAMRS